MCTTLYICFCVPWSLSPKVSFPSITISPPLPISATPAPPLWSPLLSSLGLCVCVCLVWFVHFFYIPHVSDIVFVFHLFLIQVSFLSLTALPLGNFSTPSNKKYGQQKGYTKSNKWRSAQFLFSTYFFFFRDENCTANGRLMTIKGTQH